MNNKLIEEQENRVTDVTKKIIDDYKFNENNKDEFSSSVTFINAEGNIVIILAAPNSSSSMIIKDINNIFSAFTFNSKERAAKQIKLFSDDRLYRLVKFEIINNLKESLNSIDNKEDKEWFKNKINELSK